LNALVIVVLAAVGFDHIVHDRNLVVKGGDSVPCERCHAEKQGKLVGKPGHAACFGKCHGDPPPKPSVGAKPNAGDRIKVCVACHAEAQLGKPFTGKLAVAYPPYTIDRDFNIAFGHKQHSSTSCTQCHTAGGTRAGPPHQRCASCHDGVKAANKCATCHPKAVGKPQPPELAPIRDSVATTFSHQKHAARGSVGKECVTCHFAVRATNDTELPRPAIKDCATSGCHDGRGAFATTVACVRCHERPPAEAFLVSRPEARFLHAGVHAAVVSKRACNACHPLSARGETVITGHAACVECHATDFGQRNPKICGACHNATEPWRHLVADRGPPDRTEFGATLDHGKHTGACTSCHVLRTEAAQLRTPRGHTSCMGSGCHAVKSGPLPRFDNCDGCHRLGLANERATQRAAAPWSVRITFDHDTHKAACNSCHTQLQGANVLALATPKKATCLPCHDDGKAAFKLTGTTCGRCHKGTPP